MHTDQTKFQRIDDCEAVRISLASPADIRSWSSGEVRSPTTIDFRSYEPEEGGLFCERIFGPAKDWRCACGNSRGSQFWGLRCDCCGIKVRSRRARRRRMGHIELAAPVVHIWFFKALPSRLGTLLDMKSSSLQKVIYFQDYVVIDPGGTPLQERQLLTEEEHRRARQSYGEAFEVGMGAEAIQKLLQRLDLVSLSRQLRQEVFAVGRDSGRRPFELIKRLKLVEALRDSSLDGQQNKPEWMVLECIPVVSPNLRPLVVHASGNFAMSDLNELYRRVINRNKRLKKLVDLKAPVVIIRNEKRMLQQSVDALFDNYRQRRPACGANKRPLRSLADQLRRTLYQGSSKRVDYSARSVVVPGPELKLHQCGLPRMIALELFRPFLLRRLRERGFADDIASARKMLRRKDDAVWDVLDEVVANHPVVLDRAPTLRRMDIQAFMPVLTDGMAIRVHPVVYNALGLDVEHDQVAVHLPLSLQARVEAEVLMLSPNSLFSSTNGLLTFTPGQDVVLGCAYLTVDPRAAFTEPGNAASPRTNLVSEGMVFSSPAEVFLAYALHKVGVHARIRVRLPIEKRVVTEITYQNKLIVEELPSTPGGLVFTTVGRVLFNDILDPRMAFYDLALSSKHLTRILGDCHELLGRQPTIELLDGIKEIGFREATRSGLSFSTDDLRTPVNKQEILGNAAKEVERTEKMYQRGIYTDMERYNRVLDLWTHARDQITHQLMRDLQHDMREGVPYLNPIFLMAHSGARGGVEQIRQMAGMCGLVAKPSGQTIEMLILGNFREGLSVAEYYYLASTARKGLFKSARSLADPSYLIRKLTDVAGDVVVTMHDCGTTRGITCGACYQGDYLERSLSDTIRGRVARGTLCDPLHGSLIVAENEMITRDLARRIELMGIDKIRVRSPMTCEARRGVCRLCYGMDLAAGSLVEEGMAVGMLAAQSIGEHTELSMRTFCFGPGRTFGIEPRWRVETDRHKAKKAGVVKLVGTAVVINAQGERIAVARRGLIVIVNYKGNPLEEFAVPNGAVLLVQDSQEVGPGELLCKWDPHHTPIIAERGGTIRFEEIVENETLRREHDMGGAERWVIMEHKGDLHPQIVIEDERGRNLEVHYIPEMARLKVHEGQRVTTGTLLAQRPCEVGATRDVAGGLPHVIELFEARRPRNPTRLAEVSGMVEVSEQERDRRVISIQPIDEEGRPIPDVAAVEYQVPSYKYLRVHSGDYVKAGEPLLDGPPVPYEILKVLGEQAVQKYLVQELQSIYRTQRVEIDDKHFDIVVAQMLRKVMVESVGDTELLPGAVIGKVAFREMNERLKQSVKIDDLGESRFETGQIASREAFEEARSALTREGKRPPTCVEPTLATCSALLLGITQAAMKPDSFLAAAVRYNPVEVLTEAALAGRVDSLAGLKENVIVGRLVPAGTGFPGQVLC